MTNEEYTDIHKRIEVVTKRLLAMTKDERIAWFEQSRYPLPLDFETEIGGTVYSVSVHFKEDARESLLEKAQRIITQK